MGKIRSMTPLFQSPILPVIGIAVAPCPAHSYKRVLIFKLPFKLIVATAWLANSNVDLFIRGHNKRLSPYRREPLQSYYSI